VAGAAADVGDADAGGQPVGQRTGQRQDALDQLAVQQAPRQAVHDLGERRPERLVGNPATLPGDLGDAVDVVGEQGGDLADRRQVQRPGAGQDHRVLGGKPVGARGGVVVDDPGGHQAAEALAGVALGQARPVSQLRAGGRPLRGGLQQPGTVGEVDDEGHHPAAVQSEQVLGERLDPRLVQRLARHRLEGLLVHGHVALLVDPLLTVLTVGTTRRSAHRARCATCRDGDGWFFPHGTARRSPRHGAAPG